MTINEVLLFPPRESYKSLVNLESRKGTKLPLESDKECMHFPRTLSELLIERASCSLSPVALDFLTLSEPAKSTKYKTEVTIAFGMSFS